MYIVCFVTTSLSSPGIRISQPAEETLPRLDYNIRKTNRNSYQNEQENLKGHPRKISNYCYRRILRQQKQG